MAQAQIGRLLLRSASARVPGLSCPSAPRLAQRTHQRARRRAVLARAASTAMQQDTIYDIAVKDITGEDVQLSKYKGKVVLVVNVASQCGFTVQYKELAQLYNKYKEQGLEILGFPCNQFGGQEPGDNDKILKFARERGAEFDMFSKIDVNGSTASPVYQYLKKEQSGMLFSDIKWNFTKFLLDRQGNVVKRYGSVTTPLGIEGDIKALL